MEAYVGWIRRYVVFHGKRHPGSLSGADVVRFLSSLANERGVSSSTQNQAASALLFLYREVLQIKVELPPAVAHPVKPRRVPVVLTVSEVSAVLAELTGVKQLIASLLYGSGLRLLEALRLRVKDVLLDRGELVVRGGKGNEDRVTMLPARLKPRVAVTDP